MKKYMNVSWLPLSTRRPLPQNGHDAFRLGRELADLDRRRRQHRLRPVEQISAEEEHEKEQQARGV